MEKRLILAIALSLLVLLSWQIFVVKTQPVVNKEVAATSSPLPPIPASPVKNEPLPVIEQTPEKTVEISQEKFDLIFNESQGAIWQATFRDYPSEKYNLLNGFGLTDPALRFSLDNKSAQEVKFVHRDATKEITKRFIFSKSKYEIELQVEIRNISSIPLKEKAVLSLGTLDFQPKNVQSRYSDVMIALPEKIIRPNPRQDISFEKARFAGIRDRYFCAIIEPQAQACGAYIKKSGAQFSEAGITGEEIEIAPGSQIGHLYKIYLGPQDYKLINAVQPAWSAIIYYGTFDLISSILLNILNFFYQLVHNWGVALILLSLLVYFALYPLSLKQMRSVKEMQRLQPLIEELKKANKGNPQKLNNEIMELYKEHKVNPLGGCLPLLLQMPIFFALYNGLMRSIVLKGSHFLWIRDLAEPDKLPILGREINILPILMAIGMFFQQKISMASASGEAAEQQKIMLYLMPVMFGFIFYSMPSGLVLYWLVNSILMLVYQLKISRGK